MACLGTDHTRPTREPLPTGTHRVFRLGSRSPLRTVIPGSSSRRVSHIRRDLMACCSRATAAFPTGLLIAVISCSWASTPAARGADGLGRASRRRRQKAAPSTSRVTSVPSSRTTASPATAPTTRPARRACGSTPRTGAFAKLKSGGVGDRARQAGRERPDLPDRDRRPRSCRCRPRSRASS